MEPEDLEEFNRKKKQKEEMEARKNEILQKEPEKPKGSMDVQLEIVNIVIGMPTSNQGIENAQNSLAIRTDLQVGYAAKPDPDFMSQLGDVEGKKIAKATEQCNSTNEVGAINLGVKNFEIFICEYEELTSAKEFTEIRKRNMI